MKHFFFLRAHPEEKERRELEAQLEPYKNVVTYVHAIFTWKRPREFGILYAVLVVFFLLLSWLDLTVLSIFFLFLNGLVSLWWFSDMVTIKVPWSELLGGDPDPKETYEFILLLKNRGWQLWELQQKTHPLKAAAICLIISFLGYFWNETFLFFVVLLGVMCTPGLINMRLQKLKAEEKKSS